MKVIIKSAIGIIFEAIFSVVYKKISIRIILMYHRVAKEMPSNQFYDPGMYISADSLENHIKQIRKYFKIVTLNEIINIDKSRRDCFCAITFDDGWYDNYLFAYPILKKYDIPATIFLPINYIGTENEFWFQVFWDAAQTAYDKGILNRFIKDLSIYLPDRTASIGESLKDIVESLKRIQPVELNQILQNISKSFQLKTDFRRNTINWKEVKEMENEGILFGSHGANHFILTDIDSNCKKNEIVESFKFLEKKLNNFSAFFCYPNGEWDNECINIVKSIGYKGAVTTKLGILGKRQNVFLLNRIGMHNDISNKRGLFWFRIFQAIAGIKGSK